MPPEVCSSKTASMYEMRNRQEDKTTKRIDLHFHLVF